MEYSGFFNAMYVDNEYDRKYNANDYSDNLAVVISNGVLRSGVNDLKVTANNMVCSVNAGRAWIDGHYYYNDSFYSFDQTIPPVGANRYDRIMLRLDNTIIGRKISLIYVEGDENAYPTKPEPVRDGDYYDLVLADVLVSRNSGTLVITDTRDDENLCGWVYSTIGNGEFFTALDGQFEDWFNEKKDDLASVTLFKKYTWETTLAQSASRVAFNIPQYNEDTCFADVFVNGILDNNHTIEENVVVFNDSLLAGTEITVNAYKSIDGTDIMSVSDEITELQNQMATIIGSNKYTYTCSGTNDNVALSEIAQAIYNGSYNVSTISAKAKTFLDALGGNTWLRSLPNDFQIRIDVVGTLGASSAYDGSGTSSSPYRWFRLGSDSTTSKKVVFDFANCQLIFITAISTASYNIMFHGRTIYIDNATVYVNPTTTGENSIIMFDGAGSTGVGKCEVNNCRFKVNATRLCRIASHGTFRNCRVRIQSTSGDAICFDVQTANMVHVVGGTYYSYGTGNNNVIIGYVHGQNGVLVMNNVNAPVVTLTGFSQKLIAKRTSGNAFLSGCVTSLGYEGTIETVGMISGNKPEF